MPKEVWVVITPPCSWSLVPIHHHQSPFKGRDEIMSTVAVPSPLPSATDDAESLRKALQGNACSQLVAMKSFSSFVSRCYIACIACYNCYNWPARWSRSASAGWRADKDALIRILGRRTAAQRAAIRRAYAFLYRESLLNCFRYKLSRHCLLSVDFWVHAVIYFYIKKFPWFIKWQSCLLFLVQRAMILWTMDPAERDANLVHEALKKRDHNYISVLIEVSCASTPDHLMAVRRIYRSLFGCSIEEDVAASSAFQEPLKKVIHWNF